MVWNAGGVQELRVAPGWEPARKQTSDSQLTARTWPATGMNFAVDSSPVSRMACGTLTSACETLSREPSHSSLDFGPTHCNLTHVCYEPLHLW